MRRRKERWVGGKEGGKRRKEGERERKERREGGKYIGKEGGSE